MNNCPNDFHKMQKWSFMIIFNGLAFLLILLGVNSLLIYKYQNNFFQLKKILWRFNKQDKVLFIKKIIILENNSIYTAEIICKPLSEESKKNFNEKVKLINNYYEVFYNNKNDEIIIKINNIVDKNHIKTIIQELENLYFQSLK